jgi:hypothetical protein
VERVRWAVNIVPRVLGGGIYTACFKPAYRDRE